MRKDVDTYSRRRPRKKAESARLPKKSKRSVPRWVPYGTTALFALVLCLTINFRAYSELTREVKQNESLQTQIENITSENLNLQEEIYYLQNDSNVIEREARKFGYKRQEKDKKVSVPTDK